MAALLDVLVDRQLRSSTTIVPVENGVEISVDGLTKLISFSCPHPNEDLDRFSVWCTKPSFCPESSVREVRVRCAEGKTVGYIFPSASFSVASDFSAEKLDGRFSRVFASAAALAIIQLGVANEHVVRSFEDIPDEIALGELLPSCTAIVVVGRENLRSAGVEESHVRLLLQEQGYFLADLPSEYAWVRPAPDFSLKNCSVGQVAEELWDQSELLERLICLASEQASAVASMLVYYQVIELLSEKLLVSRLTRLSSEPPLGSWQFKEALRAAVSEGSRVTSICTQAAVGLDAAVFASLHQLGCDILASTGQPATSVTNPGSALYSIRNLVVHNQVAFGTEAHKLLSEFVSCLHRAVFAMIRRFESSSAV